MGCGSAGSPYFPCVHGTKTLLYFCAGKFWSAAPTYGEHLIKRNLDISHTTLFVEIQLIELLVDYVNE